MGIVAFYRSAGIRPCGISFEGFQLPPIGINADVIEPLDNFRRRIIIHRPRLGWNDFQQHLQTVTSAGMKQAAHGILLARLQRIAVTRMVKTQNLDHMFQRPFSQPTKIRADFRLQRQRAGAGPFYRPCNPQTLTCISVKSIAAKAAIAQKAVTGLSVGHVFSGG